MRKPLLLTTALLAVSLLGQTVPATSHAAPAPATAPVPASGIASFGADWLIKGDGTFWIWDNNQSVPTQIPELTGVTASYNGLAVMDDHTVKQWYNDYYTPAITIKPVSGLSSIADSYVMGNTLVADDNGIVYTNAKTADSEAQTETVFTPLTGIDNVARMNNYTESRGNLMNYLYSFLKKDGTVWIDNGKLQNFQQVQNLRGVVQLAENYALQKDGTVWTWPASFAEETPSATVPAAARVSALPAIRTLKASQHSFLAIDSQSRLWFWGNTITGYSDGWLREDHPVPVLITSISNVKDAFLVEHSLIVQTDDNKVLETSFARSAMPANPEFTLLAKDVTSIVGGGRYMIMQKTDGSLWGWGVNKNSELGYGDYEFMHNTPVPVQKPIAVSLNGENVQLTAGVITRGGQNFVPLRSLFDKLGAEIGFNGTTKQATVTRSGDSPVTISVNAQTGQTTLNNQAVTLENQPFTVNGVLYLPLRFISEQLGATVEWLPQEGRIAISMK